MKTFFIQIFAILGVLSGKFSSKLWSTIFLKYQRKIGFWVLWKLHFLSYPLNRSFWSFLLPLTDVYPLFPSRPRPLAPTLRRSAFHSTSSFCGSTLPNRLTCHRSLVRCRVRAYSRNSNKIVSRYSTRGKFNIGRKLMTPRTFFIRISQQ